MKLITMLSLTMVSTISSFTPPKIQKRMMMTSKQKEVVQIKITKGHCSLVTRHASS